MRARPPGLALAEQDRVAEVDAAGQPGEPLRAHDRGATRREDALVVRGMARVEGLGDNEADHRIAEELQALVVARRAIRVLVEPASVDQSALEQAGVTECNPKARGQRRGRARRGRIVPRQGPVSYTH